MIMSEENKDIEKQSHVVSEPAAIYYGTSERLRESGIISEISNLGKEDTIWLIRYMQQHLDELTAIPNISIVNPLDVLDQFGSLVKATGKTSEQLIGEYLNEKYSV